MYSLPFLKYLARSDGQNDDSWTKDGTVMDKFQDTMRSNRSTCLLSNLRFDIAPHEIRTRDCNISNSLIPLSLDCIQATSVLNISGNTYTNIQYIITENNIPKNDEL